MTPTVWSRLDATARNLSPFALTVLLVIFGMVPLGLANVSPVMPALGLIAVYFWLAYRPESMPAWTVFLIGLVQDLLGGGALGVGPFVLLVVYAALAGQRRYFGSGSFVLIWLGFIVVAAGVFMLTWLFNSLILDTVVDPGPATLQYLITVAVYPCIAWLFLQAQRALLN